MESSVALHNSKGNGKLTYIGPNVIDTLLDIIIFSKDVHFEISEWLEAWYCVFISFSKAEVKNIWRWYFYCKI